jgi:quercetin dioxygenase-like cupin family protein
MNYLTILRFAVSAVLISSVSLTAVAQSTEKGPVRTVLALGRIPSVVDGPLSMKLSRISMAMGASIVHGGSHSMLYVLSGVVTVTVANDRRLIRPGEGAYLPPGSDAAIQTGPDGPAELLQYQLVRSTDASKPGTNASAPVTELHQMKIPSQALKPGPHEFSMTRVTIPAGAPKPRPHTRSGAALYYVLAAGAITIWPSATAETLLGESRIESRRAGEVQEEPYGFIHTWSSMADTELVLLQANISQEGVPEIIFVK